MPNLIGTALRGSLGNPNKSLRFRVAGLASIALLAVSSFSTVTTNAMATTEPTVPYRMHLSAVMKESKKWLTKSSLIPIDFSPSLGDLVAEGDAVKGPKVVSENAGQGGSICFLTELAASEPEVFSNFGFFGVVKETGVDDEGLRNFHEKYYPFPLYRDEKLDFYRAFGDKKITSNMSMSSLLNPFKVYRGMKKIGDRLKAKKIEGNFVGEGLKTGGLIFFGADGEPKYAYPERTGDPLDADDILAALRDVSGIPENKDEL